MISLSVPIGTLTASTRVILARFIPTLVPKRWFAAFDPQPVAETPMSGAFAKCAA
jgi:hypothetical protein